MSLYVNVAVMLAATIAAFLILARVSEALRAGRLSFPWHYKGRSRLPGTPSRLAIEQVCVVDGKRRLVLVRCEDQRILLMTGGPTDLIVSVSPIVRIAGDLA